MLTQQAIAEGQARGLFALSQIAADYRMRTGARILAARRNGDTWRDIEAREGISHATAWRWARAALKADVSTVGIQTHETN